VVLSTKELSLDLFYRCVGISPALVASFFAHDLVGRCPVIAIADDVGGGDRGHGNLEGYVQPKITI
jgi:hypothetical protein